MRIAVPLGGTDRGRSGLGSYVRAIVPLLADRMRGRAGSMVALGTGRDFDAYADVLDGVERAALPEACDLPLTSAAWHLGWAGRRARDVGADVLLLPAGNRRSTAWSPVPTVAVVHDLAQVRVRGKYDALRMAYVRQILVRALRSIDQLVAVSTATRDDLACELGIVADRVRVVPNGVDAARFRPVDAGHPSAVAARAHLGIASPYLLYVSRLEHPGKNHLRLLRAFAASRACAGHTLVLVGGDWGGERTIRREARRLGLGDRLQVAGYTDGALLPGLMAGADAVLMVGLCEGFGLPALEALAAGRPVVAARAGALPEVVGDLAALCDPLDEESIARALERALADGVLRERCHSEGPRWAAARGWDRTADGLLDACMEVVKP